MIGEQFDHGDEICGAVVNVRTRPPQERIALWTKNAANEVAQVVANNLPVLLDCSSHVIIFLSFFFMKAMFTR